MRFKKKGEKVNQNMKLYGTLSILEKGVYSKTPKLISKSRDYSVMEMKIYNSTRHGGKELWQKIKRFLGKNTEEDF